MTSAPDSDSAVRRPAGRPGWPTHAASAAVLLAALAGSADYFWPFVVALAGVPTLCSLWLLRLLAWPARRAACRGQLRRSEARGWFVLPVLAATGAVLIGLDLPARGLLAAHRANLERLAVLADASSAPPTLARRVGVYGTVAATRLAPGVIGISVPGMGMAGNDGYLYVANDRWPEDPPPSLAGPAVGRRLAPCWYVWHRTWV